MGKAIGIDLGTTNSCAAYVHDGRPRIITFRDGSRTIPSVFAIDKTGNRLVGKEAKDQSNANPNQTISASKRLIGRSFDGSSVEQMKQVFTYDLLEGDDNQVLIKVADQVLTLEQISAAILRSIKEAAEGALDEPVDQAVITVPAYFNDRQRQAVRSAGTLAGLKVLRVLNEPTAAALAYGHGRGLHQRIVIYDLGGGTFDVSVIDIKDQLFEVRATGGDTFLGGVDFDDRLMQTVLTTFADETDIDVSYDRTAVARIRDASENAKIRLSSVDDTAIQLDAISDDSGESADLLHKASRVALEALTEDLVDRSIATCERILAEAHCSKAEIDDILLVGGQSRMPLVRQKLEAFWERPPSDKVHPDEAVALGAAIMAHSLSAGDSQKVTLLDVLPMPIGLSKPDGTMHVLFEKNLALPAYKNITLTTHKNEQRSILVRIYQGESERVDENERLGSFVFSGIRPAPAGEVQIEITFHMDSEGILNLTARDADTGHVVETRLKLDGEARRKKDTPAPRPKAPPVAQPRPEAAAEPPTDPLAHEEDITEETTVISGKPPIMRTPAPSTSVTAPAQLDAAPPAGSGIASKAPPPLAPVQPSIDGTSTEPSFVPTQPDAESPKKSLLSRLFGWFGGK